jgi:hypothetical protein
MYCNDAHSLFGALGYVHNPEEWWLFIDSAKPSLKAVLLHSGNIYPTVPLAYSVHMKKSRESTCTLLNCIDLKVIGLLLGMLQGYTKYCCLLCEWDSHDKKHHYVRNN